MAVKLLLADESFTIRKVVQIIYRKTDTDVIIVGNQDELLSAIKNIEPDIILLSVSFPGIKLSVDIKTFISPDQAPIPVVLMADRGDPIDAAAAKKLGANAFLYKPLDNRELKRTVEDILSVEAPVAAEEAETSVSPAVQIETLAAPSPVITEPLLTPPIPTMVTATPEQRAKVLMEILESYLNENVVLLTESLARNLAPKIAPEVASKIMESIDFTDLPYKVAKIIEGVIRDLVPQLAEELLSREIDIIKEEAARILSSEDRD